jgi:hypothetical protein
MSDMGEELSVGDFYERAKQVFVENDTNSNGVLSCDIWLINSLSDPPLPFLSTLSRAQQ